MRAVFLPGFRTKTGCSETSRHFRDLFDHDSDVIRAESKPVLDEVLGVLKSEPEWKITIEGHTDAVGTDDYNMTLSRKRAESVAAYLVAAGISMPGDSKPPASVNPNLWPTTASNLGVPRTGEWSWFGKIKTKNVSD